jgi:hypothetical protein
VVGERRMGDPHRQRDADQHCYAPPHRRSPFIAHLSTRTARHGNSCGYCATAD